MFTLIDGQAVAANIKTTIAEKLATYKLKNGSVPTLAVFIVGDNPASKVYVAGKERATELVGIRSIVERLPQDTTEAQLIAKIAEHNADDSIHGILVQLPLPTHIDAMRVTIAIAPEKDVDGFHPVNVGLLSIGTPQFIPCTPYGIMKLLETYNINPAGKLAVIVGRSNIVGKPIANLLLQADATVALCHSKTSDLKELCKQADILIAAVGKPNVITREYVKSGAVVIDVGINRLADGKLCGDVDFESVNKVASAITPVPKGVGPMTIAMLMQNTLEAYERFAGNNP
ncbi:bifunctional protein FolD [Deferribacterales bacterium]|nr:bifunctional protein FolD [Deferribacterales bacterium]